MSANVDNVELATSSPSLEVTSHPSSIVSHSNLDVVRWRELLSHETVLTSGTIPVSSSSGYSLFTFEVNPASLSSSTHKSILKHLAELFTQWNGTVRFTLITSLPMFMATKIVFAFVPQPLSPEKMSPGTLLGLQNSVVCNPSNETQVQLAVPFVSGYNWLNTNAGTGYVVAKLLEPIVTTQPTTTGIPWTLTVSADPSSFNFRYIVPPPLSSTSNESDSGSPATAGPSQNQIVTATMMSTRKRNPAQAATYSTVVDYPLIQQPRANPGAQFKTMLLIPRTRVEYVMQKVRGQYPNGTERMEILRMFDVPGYTSKTYELLTLPPTCTLFPYTQNGCYVAKFDSIDSSEWPACPMIIKEYRNQRYVYMQVDDGAKNILEDYIARTGVSKYDLALYWFVGNAIAGGASSTFYVVSYAGTDTYNGLSYLRFYSEASGNTSITDSYAFYPVVYVKLVVNTINPFKERVLNLLAEVDQAPSTVTHLALYTTMPQDLAKTFNAWLITADNTAPPSAALGYSIAFNPNQAQLGYANGRMEETEDVTRGIIWKLFKLFKGDETKWWAWLIRGLDFIVDLLIGAFLSRDVGEVVDISSGSGFCVEAVGDYDPSLVTQSQSLVRLDTVEPRVCQSTTQLEAAALSRAYARSKFKLRSRSRTPETHPSFAFADPSASEPRSLSRSRKNSKWRAKHPSPKKVSPTKWSTLR